MFIYKLTNKINGKAYIGLTTNFLERRLIQRHYDARQSCIFACLQGKRKTHKGYQWKYYKDWRDDQFVSPDL